MKAGLPKKLAVQFEKLQTKHPAVIASVLQGGCLMCGIGLPISLVQLVRMEKDIQYCPNCARMLYYPESSPKWIGKAPRRSAPRKAGISRFSSHSLVIPRLAAETKEEAIRELADKMESDGFIDSAEKLTELALRREAIISTSVAHGMALPHVRGVEGGGIALALGISKKGIRWDGPDGKLSRIIFFMTIPTAASAFYLKLLAGLSETFSKAASREAVTEEEKPEKLWKVLVKLTRTTVK